MSVKREQICRLCIKPTKNEYKDIDKTLKVTFNILLLKLDLDITRDPLVCRDCVRIAKKCLDFKYTCVNTERIILSFSNARENAKYDIKFICKAEKDVEAVNNEDFNICRFCTTRVGKNDFVPLDILMNDNIFAMLLGYLPEMDFNIIENAIICTTCKETLEEYFQFVLICLDTETKIKSYCKEERSDMYQIKLCNVLGFLIKDVLEGPKSPQIRNNKSESKIIYDTECVYPEVCSGLIKQKDLDIKEADSEEYTEDSPVHRDYLEVKWNEGSNIEINQHLECSDETEQSKHIKSNLMIASYASKMDTSEKVSDPKLGNDANRSSPTQRKLQSPASVHKDISKKQLHKCSLCAYESPRSNTLKTHMLVHSDVLKVKMYKCSLCAYEAKRKSHLDRHMLVHKNDSETKMYTCSLCAFESKHRNSFTKHMLIHKDVSEVKLFKCTLCAYASKQKSCLTNHMLVHKNDSETEMFKCALCAFETKHKRSLEFHVLIHKDVSEIEMFSCPLCAFESKYKRGLANHMLIHKGFSDRELFECSVCAIKFRSKCSLTTHMLVHKNISEIKMFKCSLCTYEAKQKSTLNRHMLIHKNVSQIKAYTCSLCAFESKYKSSLANHMLIHKGVSEIKRNDIGNIKQGSNGLQAKECMYPEACSGLIKQEELDIKEEDTEEHTYQQKVQANTKEDGTIYRDDLEEKWNESSNIEINQHVMCTDETEQSKHIKSNLVSTSCVSKMDISKNPENVSDPKLGNNADRSGSIQSKLQSSVSAHKDISKKKLHKCSFCAYESPRSHTLKTHMLVHSDILKVKMYKCSLCAYEAKRKSHLDRHMLVHKNDSETKMFTCSLCAFESKHRNSFTKHMLIHKDVSEVRMFKCSLCAYESKQKSTLKSHMLVHKNDSETKMYKCSLCNFESKHKNSLPYHMLVHKDVSEIEMFNCSLCTFKSRHKRSLANHMLIHKGVSGRKLFECSVCATKFRSKCSLTTHMLVHKNISEIKMFKCSLCAYECLHKHNLRRHNMLAHKNVSQIKKYTCSLCDFKVKNKGNLARHMSVHKDIS